MATPAPLPYVPISWGELVDRLTILEIKSAKLSRPEALANVRKDLALLSTFFEEARSRNADLGGLKDRLREVNEALWKVENDIREKEAARAFDQAFIDLARAVYLNNDRRAALKREINVLLSSELSEEKSYSNY